MTDLDPLLDPTGRIEPVQNAIIGGRSLWEDARARLFRNRAPFLTCAPLRRRWKACIRSEPTCRDETCLRA